MRRCGYRRPRHVSTVLTQRAAGPKAPPSRKGFQMAKNTGTWTAFLVVCFAVVGLTGLFASYAAPLSYERADRFDAALDTALATEGQPDAKPRLEALRDRLDTSAAAVIDGTGPLAERVAAARRQMHADMQRDADAVGSRLRLMLLVVTVVAALFGAILLRAAAGG